MHVLIVLYCVPLGVAGRVLAAVAAPGRLRAGGVRDARAVHAARRPRAARRAQRARRALAAPPTRRLRNNV